MPRKVLWLVMGCLVCVMGWNAQAQTNPIDADGRVNAAVVQQAILEQGANWVAKDTPISRMTQVERAAVLCPAPQPAEGDMDVEQDVPVLRDMRAGPDVDVSMKRLDWHNLNGVDWTTPVKDQGLCGSCWAHGPLAAAETEINILKNDPEVDFDLSEQFMVSCSMGSCTWGGNPDQVMQSLKSTGVPDEKCFPYTATDSSCSLRCSDWQKRVIKITSYGHVKNSTSSVQQIKQYLVQGPMSLSMNVYTDFTTYTSGVYKHVSGTNEGGHCITVVGWDDDHGSWIIKNSWGVIWGEMGFGEIVQNDQSISGQSMEWLKMPDPKLLGIPCVTPMDIQMEAYQDSAPDQEIMHIRNCGEATLHWSNQPFNADWLKLDPSSGTLEVGKTVDVTLYADPTGMSAEITKNSGVTILGDHRDSKVSITFTVRRLKAPTVDFSGEPTKGKAPLTVAFKADIGGTFNKVTWNFGDGKTATDDQNPSHTYKKAGKYTVSIEVSGTQGKASQKKSDYITVTGESLPDGGTPANGSDASSGDGGNGAGEADSTGGCGCSVAGGQGSGLFGAGLAGLAFLGLMLRKWF